MSGGIVIRDMAMAEAVPDWSTLGGDGGWATVRPKQPARPGDILTHIAVPVADAQAMRAEMLAEAQWHRNRDLNRVAHVIEAWVERLFPEDVFAPPPAPEPVDEVDPWEWDVLLSVDGGVSVEEWDAYGTMFHVGEHTVYVDRRNDGRWDRHPEGWLVEVDDEGRRRMTDLDLRRTLTRLATSAALAAHDAGEGK